MDTQILKAKSRTFSGRKVKRLRKEGMLPANIYGRKVDSKSVEVELSEFLKVFKKAGETSLVELEVDGKKIPTLIHNVQLDPITDIPLHADFLQVNLKEKVTAKVPLEFTGISPAEKQGLGTVVKYVDEIEVEALPSDLPDKFELDLTTLENVDQTVQVKDLKIDEKKVEVKLDKETIIIKVEPPVKEEEIEVKAPEVTGDEAPQVSGGEGQTEKPAEEPKTSN